jgi:hypothetical protein
VVLGRVVGAHPDVRVQIEPLQVCVARAARSNCGRREPTAKPADLRPRAGAQSRAALHGSAHDAGERWRSLGDRIFGARAVLAGLEAAAAQEPPNPSPDRAEHLRQWVEHHVRRDLYAHLETLPPAFYLTHRTGDLMSRAERR